jgi:hypothetical protein
MRRSYFRKVHLVGRREAALYTCLVQGIDQQMCCEGLYVGRGHGEVTNGATAEEAQRT